MNSNLFKKFIFLFIIFCVSGSITTAQVLPPGFEEEVILKISPSIPAPKENVSVRLENYSTDLNKSNIIWSLDGIVQEQGVGKITYQFTAPEAGRQTTLKVDVQKNTGGTLSESLQIAPAGLDLMYEANTYIPPFYKGRSLFSHQSIVTVAAIPDFTTNGAKVSKENIIYTWEKDNEVIQSISGQGKDSAQFLGKLISRPFTVTVTAESVNSNIKARKKITINPIEPTVVLYENNPVQGSIFEKALSGTFNFDREEVGITAIPYFFSAQNRSDSSLKFSWFENGAKIGDDLFGSDLIYTNIGRAKSGISNLQISVDHVQNILQSGNNGFRVNVIGNEQSATISSDETNVF